MMKCCAISDKLHGKHPGEGPRTGPIGRMIAALMFGLAEIEWEYIHERQAAGISVARQRGMYRGRKRGTTKASPERAKDLRGKGLKIDEIAEAMGTSPRTVKRYLAV